LRELGFLGGEGGKRGTYGFDGVLDDIAGRYDVPRLPHAVDAIKGLLFQHGVPLGLDEVHVVCGREVDAKPREISIYIRI